MLADGRKTENIAGHVVTNEEFYKVLESLRHEKKRKESRVS